MSSNATNISNLQRQGQGTPARHEAPNSFPGFLKAYASEIKRALPAHMNADRMTRIALTEFRKNPKLGDCDPKSVFAAVIMGSQLGLEPGIMGQAYMIPYGRECQFVPGWQGLVDLVSRAGRASVWTGAVFEGDEFDYALGDRPFIKHKPGGEDDPAALLYVYAVGRINGSEWPIIEVWNIKKVLKHRDRFNKVGKRHYSFQHLEMYARKVPLMQILKYMPKSVELATAMALDTAAESGNQNLNANEVIEGSWAPPPEDNGQDMQEEDTGTQATQQQATAQAEAPAASQETRQTRATEHAQPESRREAPSSQPAAGADQFDF